MAVKIKIFNTHNLRNSAHHKFHVDVERLIIEFAAARLNILALFAAYQPAILREDEAYKKIVKSEFTSQIEAADKARDKAYSNIAATVRMLLKHHNPAIVAIAKRLKILLDAYDKINQKSYNEQTGDINNLMQEFRGAYAADIETIRIPELVDELERTNNVFEALMQERLDETANKNHDKMKDARANTDAAYNAIVERINAAVVMEGPENYAAFITKLNLLIDEYKLLITKSHHHAKPAEPAAKAKKPEPKTGAKKPEPKKPEAKEGAKAKKPEAKKAAAKAKAETAE